MSDARDEQEAPHGLLEPYCWYAGHNWTDDPFLGSGKECRRCGAFDQPLWDGSSSIEFILGLLVGTLLGAALVAVVLL